MKKIRKKFKAMTLVEVIVALAVFAIISALLASACANVCSIRQKADRLNKKVAVEAPAAELKDDEYPVTDASGNSETTMTLKIGDKSFEVPGKKYVASDPDNNYEDGGDFKYFIPDTKNVQEVP